MSTVVITGGSRGIGAAAVELFARQGHQVYFLYEKNHAAAQAVSEKTGATGICCDVADSQAVQAAFRQIGQVDILILCAGICHYGLLQDLKEADWDRLFAVNVKGSYLCINAAMPSFLKKQKGCIITVSSMWGQVGASCEAAYSATKGDPYGYVCQCIFGDPGRNGRRQLRWPQRHASGCSTGICLSGRSRICYRTGPQRQRRLCDLTIDTRRKI